MKKLIVLAGIAVLTLSLSGAAIAQTTTKTQKDKQHVGRMHGKKHGAMRQVLKQQLAEKLGLTDAQKERIHVLNEQFKAQVKAQKDSKLEREAKRKQMKALFKGHRENILSVLTPEQKAKLKEMRKVRRGPAKRGG